MIGYFLSELKLYKTNFALWLPLLAVIALEIFSVDVDNVKDSLMSYVWGNIIFTSFFIAYGTDKRFAIIKAQQFDTLLQVLPDNTSYMRAIIAFQGIACIIIFTLQIGVLLFMGLAELIDWQFIVLYITSYLLALFIQLVLFWILQLRFKLAFLNTFLVIFLYISVFVLYLNEVIPNENVIAFDVSLRVWTENVEKLLLNEIDANEALQAIVLSLIPKVILSISLLWLLLQTTRKVEISPSNNESILHEKLRFNLQATSNTLLRMAYPVRIYSAWLFFTPWIVLPLIAVYILTNQAIDIPVETVLSLVTVVCMFFILPMFMYVNLGKEENNQITTFFAGTPYSLLRYRLRQALIFFIFACNIVMAQLVVFALLLATGNIELNYFVNQLFYFVLQYPALCMLIIAIGFSLYLVTSVKFMVYLSIMVFVLVAEYIKDSSLLINIVNFPDIIYSLEIGEHIISVEFVLLISLYWLAIAFIIILTTAIFSDISTKKDFGRSVFLPERKSIILPAAFCVLVAGSIHLGFIFQIVQKQNQGFILVDSIKNIDTIYDSLSVKYKNIPEMTIKRITGEMFIERKSVRAHLIYTLINITDQPVSTFIMRVSPQSLSGYYKWDINIGTQGSVVNKDIVKIITLKKPLQVGDTLSFPCYFEHEESWFNSKKYFFDKITIWNHDLLPSSIGFLLQDSLSEENSAINESSAMLSSVVDTAILDIKVHSNNAKFYPLAQDVVHINDSSWRVRSTNKILSHSTNVKPTIYFLSGELNHHTKEIKGKNIHVLSLKKRTNSEMQILFQFVSKIILYYESVGIKISNRDVYLFDNPIIELRMENILGRTYIGGIELKSNIIDEIISGSISDKNREAISVLAHELAHFFTPYSIPAVSLTSETMYSEGIPQFLALSYLKYYSSRYWKSKFINNLKEIDAYMNGKLDSSTADVTQHYTLSYMAQHAISTIMGQENYFAALKKAYTENIPISKYTFTRYLPDKTADIEIVIKQWKSMKFHRDIVLSSANAVKSTENTSWELSIEAEDSLAVENLPLYCSVEGEGKEANIAATSVVTRKKKGYRITCIVPFKPSHVRINPYVLPENTYENNESRVGLRNL